VIAIRRCHPGRHPKMSGQSCEARRRRAKRLHAVAFAALTENGGRGRPTSSSGGALQRLRGPLRDYRRRSRRIWPLIVVTPNSFSVTAKTGASGTGVPPEVLSRCRVTRRIPDVFHAAADACNDHSGEPRAAGIAHVTSLVRGRIPPAGTRRSGGLIFVREKEER
jgi:hypothetical protein